MCHLRIPKFISHVDNKSEINPIIRTADMSANTCADGIKNFTTKKSTTIDASAEIVNVTPVLQESSALSSRSPSFLLSKRVVNRISVSTPYPISISNAPTLAIDNGIPNRDILPTAIERLQKSGTA